MVELSQLLVVLIFFTFFGFLVFELGSFRFNLFDTPIYLAISIPLISLIYFIFRFINIPFQVVGLFIVLICILGFFKTTLIKIELRKNSLFFLVFTIIGTIVLSGSSFFEGFNKEGSLFISDTKAHDALWHIALEEAIKKSIPPINPVFAGENLKNYHYLTDVFVSFLSQLTNTSVINVFFKWEPIILSILFISTTYLLLFQITKKVVTSYLGSALVLFSSSLAYFVPWYFKDAGFGQSIFWLDQPTRYLVNPQLILSLIMVNVIFLLILKSSKKYWFIIAMLFGLLVGIKVYGFIILLGVFCLMSLLSLKDKNWEFAKITISGFVFAGLFLILAGANSGFPFILKPGWFIGSMYQSADRLNDPQWEIHRQLFLEKSNYPRLIIHWTIGFLIFFAGNFGLKILGLPIAVFYLKKISKLEPFLLCTIFSLLISLVLPILFLQKGVVWNTIQFMHYGQIPLVILLVYFIRRFSMKYQVITLLLVLLLGLPVTILEVKHNFQLKSYAVYEKELVDGLNRIDDLVGKNKTILVSSDLYGSSIVPALSRREVFFADLGIIEILRISSLERISYIDSIEKGLQNCKENEVLVAFKNDKISIVDCSVSRKSLLDH